MDSHPLEITKRSAKYQWILCLALACVFGIGLLFLWYKNKNTSVQQDKTTFSPETFLKSSWEDYKNKFINSEGRVIDPGQNNATTSEGQSYALLRSVWIDDKQTFDKVWQFTKTHLMREDKLIGWKWVQKEDTSWGFLPEGGENSATDADIDIALALILAQRRWHDDSNQPDIKNLLKAIWDIETVEVNQKRYLIAGNWANYEDRIILNPSYFAPHAWRIFAEVDKDHNWQSLIDPAYEVLNSSGINPLRENVAVGLPPDWVALSKKDNRLLPPDSQMSTDFSFDAIRIPFRVAIDYMWFGEQKARDYLVRSFAFLKTAYQRDGKLVYSYTHSGEKKTEDENPAMYAMALGYFLIEDKTIAEDIYQNKILKLYSNGTNSFREDLPYYEQNLLWFGVALYNNKILKP